MDAAEYDQKRANYLIANGYRVVRFWNNEVFNKIHDVFDTIFNALENNSSENTLIRRCAPPSPQGGKGI